MRKIKFRGKDLKTGEWAYGDLHLLCDQPHIHTEQTAYPYAGRRSFIDPETIGQFTGWVDKNGVEIYDGDILDAHVFCEIDKKDDHRKRKVIFNDGSFLIVNNNNDCVCDRVTTSVKIEYSVIGNIYDNNDLMTQ